MMQIIETEGEDADVAAMNREFEALQSLQNSVEIVDTKQDADPDERPLPSSSPLPPLPAEFWREEPPFFPQDNSVTSDPPANSKVYSHYFKRLPTTISHIDVYRVIQMFDVPAGPVDHAVKKLLCLGKRGLKTTRQDLVEARDSITRAIEIIDEDEDSVALDKAYKDETP